MKIEIGDIFNEVEKEKTFTKKIAVTLYLNREIYKFVKSNLKNQSISCLIDSFLLDVFTQIKQIKQEKKE